MSLVFIFLVFKSIQNTSQSPGLFVFLTILLSLFVRFLLFFSICIHIFLCVHSACLSIIFLLVFTTYISSFLSLCVFYLSPFLSICLFLQISPLSLCFRPALYLSLSFPINISPYLSYSPTIHFVVVYSLIKNNTFTFSGEKKILR